MKYLGSFEAIVHEVGDGEREHLLRAFIPVLNIITGWARPKFGSQQTYTPPVGQGVWIEFKWPADGTEHPIWSGWYPVSPDGVSEIPPVGQQAPIGPAPLNRGLRNAVTADLSTTLGAPAPVSFQEVPTQRTTVYPNNAVAQSPNGQLREERDDTPGKGRLHRRAGAYYDEGFVSGLFAQGGSALIQFWTDAARRFVGGPLAEVIAGDAHSTYERNRVVSIGQTLFAQVARMRARVGSMSFVTDEVTLTQDTSGGAPLRVGGSELYSRGMLRLLALGEVLIRGKSAILTSLEQTTVSSSGDVLIEALGSISNPLGVGPFKDTDGVATVRAKDRVVLTTVASNAAEALLSRASATVNDDGLDVSAAVAIPGLARGLLAVDPKFPEALGKAVGALVLEAALTNSKQALSELAAVLIFPGSFATVTTALKAD